MNTKQMIEKAFSYTEEGYDCVKRNTETTVTAYGKDRTQGAWRFRYNSETDQWEESHVSINRPEGIICETKEELLKSFGLLKEGMGAFIEEATGNEGINNDNLWENMKPIVPGLIIATLFAIGIVVVERLVNRSSKGKA